MFQPMLGQGPRFQAGDKVWYPDLGIVTVKTFGNAYVRFEEYEGQYYAFKCERIEK